MKKLIVFLVVLLLATFGFSQIIYYVSQVDGNDSNNGLAQTDEGGGVGPWLTIARADNLAGDQSDNFVLFKTDGTWHEQWTLACDGTSGHPFTIGAYGTGAKPVIDGDDTRNFCISMTDKDYVTIDGLELKDAINTQTGGGSNGGCVGWFGGTGLVAQNCDIYHPNGRGFMINNCSNCTIDSNLIDTTSDAPTSAYENDSLYIQNGSGGHTITHNEIYHRKTATGFYIDGIQTYNEDGGTIAYNFLCNPNGCDQGTSMLIQIEAGTGTWDVYYNILFNDSNPEPMFIINAPSATINVYNNVMVNLAGGSPYDSPVMHITTGDTDNWTLRNNIFYTSESLCLYTHGIDSTDQLDYNCYYRASGSDLIDDGSTLDFDEMQTDGYEAHGMDADPLLVDYDGEEDVDYKIVTGSPCKDTGTDVGLSVDYFGNLLPSGVAEDIGAHEYQQGDIPVLRIRNVLRLRQTLRIK